MNIAIAGYAVEGKSNYDYFSRQGHNLTIIDERESLHDAPSGIPTRLGKSAFKNLDDFDMVVRTASMPPAKLRGAKKVWSTANEFFAQCPAPIIGVTGTKGKGTTVSLIASILRRAGKTVHVVGNIGKPALDELPNISSKDIVVYELSSFQLWDLKKSPHIAVVLMIEPDHLDIHASFEEYITAKAKIVASQTESDFVIFAKQNEYAANIAGMSRAQKVGVQSHDTVYVQDGFFWDKDEKICAVSALLLPGAHNQDNACAAIAAAWLYVQDKESIAAGLSDFKGLPHRLKLVRTVNDVRYYDDSIATTIGSAIAAIHAFSQPKILILGGSSKGVVDFASLVDVAASEGVKAVVAIGDQADLIEQSFSSTKIPVKNMGQQVTMREIVAEATRLAIPGDIVILSPACASFGMFKNYTDRGDQFVAAVNEL
ncbi:MAG TPA: UDP-N-acetylmuramoyl-L-alanine--D-glutamate ligase [Candidatus Saccharimonadales bacterium]|nr:UDP-N-acetylmuramoyl-L-alanine--D-glutamate ligase [Candidatus Saccharimonadales bacterium]